MRGGSIVARGKSVNQNSEITLEDFDILSVLGRGAFGKVFLARLKEEKQLYAIKTLRKDMLIEKDAVLNT
jgi:serine/threonine protein kinase